MYFSIRSKATLESGFNPDRDVEYTFDMQSGLPFFGVTYKEPSDIFYLAPGTMNHGRSLVGYSCEDGNYIAYIGFFDILFDIVEKIPSGVVKTYHSDKPFDVYKLEAKLQPTSHLPLPHEIPVDYVKQVLFTFTTSKAMKRLADRYAGTKFSRVLYKHWRDVGVTKLGLYRKLFDTDNPTLLNALLNDRPGGIELYDKAVNEWKLDQPTWFNPTYRYESEVGYGV